MLEHFQTFAEPTSQYSDMELIQTAKVFEMNAPFSAITEIVRQWAKFKREQLEAETTPEPEPEPTPEPTQYNTLEPRVKMLEEQIDMVSKAVERNRDEIRSLNRRLNHVKQ